MADTRQSVAWAIERKCPFRSGDQWFQPFETHGQLADLRTVASAERDGSIFNGICVTSWWLAWLAGEFGDVRVPDSGFRIEERLSRIGGLPMALATCRACEANAKTNLGIDVAGCFGFLDIWPDSKELDQQLRRIVEERYLEERLRALFPATRPFWYGFWIDSPLRTMQAEFLLELLKAAWANESSPKHGVQHFLHALEAAIRWELPVHVAVPPPGHTDFGRYTVFPHCPRCKAAANVPRWQSSYPKEPYECDVCGHTYIPDEHHSQDEETDVYEETDLLEKQLGKAGYLEFVRGFLIHLGRSPALVEKVIEDLRNERTEDR